MIVKDLIHRLLNCPMDAEVQMPDGLPITHLTQESTSVVTLSDYNPPPKKPYTVHHSLNISGTHLATCITISVNDLIDLFGLPQIDGEDDEEMITWFLTDEGNNPYSIYDWRQEYDSDAPDKPIYFHIGALSTFKGESLKEYLQEQVKFLRWKKQNSSHAQK